MRALVLASLALLAGCDSIFGLVRAEDDAGIGDAAPADAASAITLLSVAGPVAVNDTVTVTAQIRHTPDEVVPYALSATAGVVEPLTGSVVLESTGGGTITAKYKAPATPLTDTVSLVALGETRSVMVLIHPINTFGNDTAGNGTQLATPNTGFASTVMVTTGGTVRTLGAWIPTSNAYNLKLALYTDENNHPSIKLAETAGGPQVSGRNELPTTTRTPINPGTYWVVAAADGSTSYAVSPTGAYSFGTLSYLSGFPATFGPGAFTVQPGVTTQFFVSVAEQ